jgi:hypothetical protein
VHAELTKFNLENEKLNKQFNDFDKKFSDLANADLENKKISDEVLAKEMSDFEGLNNRFNEVNEKLNEFYLKE